MGIILQQLIVITPLMIHKLSPLSWDFLNKFNQFNSNKNLLEIIL